MKITSVNNDLIKETAKLQQRKFRDESGLFLLEGTKCIEEAILYGIEITNIFSVESFDKFKEYDCIEVTDAVMSKISSTTTPPKTVAVAKRPINKWNKNYTKVILLEDIKDAGNLGTIIRTACAFDIDAIILYGDTVDLYNPKCVRASVGNLWKVPVFNFNVLNDLKETFNSYERIATLPKSNNSIWLQDYKPSSKILVMFGTESSGLSEELKNYATKNITIEMSDKVESLNLSISVGIMLHNIFKMM